VSFDSGATTFGELVATRVAARTSQIVVGLDPDPAALWPGSWDVSSDAGTAAQRCARAVTVHCFNVIDAVADSVVGVKLQAACFERLGPPGWAALHAVSSHSRDAGLLVIIDGKRGDIDVSAAAYADSLFGSWSTPAGEIASLGADAATVAPYMGTDTVAPFVSAADRFGAGVFVLVRTSNPGAAEIEDALLADGRPVWEAAAAIVDDLSGPGDGLSGVGAVIGATAPAQLERARELLPRAVFLLPGVGAQGGSISDLRPAFHPGPAGGLITVSRSIVGGGTGGPVEAHVAAERLRAEAWAISAA
jgi:orotidine-5'-phosphate decarboxylase